MVLMCLLSAPTASRPASLLTLSSKAEAVHRRRASEEPTEPSRPVSGSAKGALPEVVGFVNT